jgi:putative ABC transport system permease protein
MALLFVQFAGVSFAGALLTVIVLQYHLLLNKDLGYVTENVYYTENTNSISDETFALLKNELLQRPEISNVSITSNLPMDFLTGFEIFDDKNGESLFSSRGMAADKDFFETMQMEMLSGQYFTESKFNYSEAVVNEEFVKMMGITGAAVGQTFVTKLDDVLSVKIIGVVKNFNIFTLYKQSSMQDIPPLIIFSREEARRDWWHPFNRLVVRTHSANSELYAQLNIHIRKMFNSNIVYFEPYRMKIEQMYDATLVYRNTVWAAVAVLCIITILGLFGYLHNETIRRRQEILIRRIHGATIVNILYLFSKYIIGIFIPAILTGFIIAYFIGIKWLESFSVKISLNVSLFFTVGIFLLAGIFVCISLQIADIMRKNVSQFLTK